MFPNFDSKTIQYIQKIKPIKKVAISQVSINNKINFK